MLYTYAVVQPSVLSQVVLFTILCMYLLFSCLRALTHTVPSAWNPAPSFFFNGHIHLKSKDCSHYPSPKWCVLPRDSYRTCIVCLPINEVSHILLLPEPGILHCTLAFMRPRGSIREWIKSRVSITRWLSLNLSRPLPGCVVSGRLLHLTVSCFLVYKRDNILLPHGICED